MHDVSKHIMRREARRGERSRSGMEADVENFLSRGEAVGVEAYLVSPR